MRALCPAEPGSKQLEVRVFSEEWWGDGVHFRQRPPNFLVEWVGPESGIAAFSWLEISRPRSSLLQQLQVATPDHVSYSDADALVPLQVPMNVSANETDFECMFRCPELDACIGPSLWCDGKDHCPSGWDESETQCGAASRLLSTLPGAALAAAAAVAASLVLLLCLALHRLRAKRRRKLAKKKLLTGPRLLDSGFNS